MEGGKLFEEIIAANGVINDAFNPNKSNLAGRKFQSAQLEAGVDALIDSIVKASKKVANANEKDLDDVSKELK